MPRPDRPRRRLRGGVALVAFVLAAGVGTPGAVAQEEAPPAVPPDDSGFGGYIVSSRGNGLQLTYDSPGLLPVGSPIFQLSVPEALATLSSGNGYALSSFAFPGPLIADLGTVLAVAGMGEGVPTYPVRAEAFHPSGPARASEGQQGTEMTSVAEQGDSRALASFAGLDFAPAARVGGARSIARSSIEGDQVVSRSRSEVSEVVLFGGIITIESVITDLVATSNGAESASDGGTRATGVRVLGVPAVLDADGIRFADDTGPDPGTNPVGGPLDDGLGGALDPVGDALGQAAGPLNDLLDQVGASGDDALQQLFDASGIEVRLLDPTESAQGGSVDRVANGLSVTMNYDGSNTPVLTELLSLVPSSALPPQNLGPIPFSPQALFNLLKEKHIVGVALAPANASAKATPAFELGPSDVSIDVPLGGADVPVSGTGTTFDPGSPDPGGFETATPELPPATAGGAVPASSTPPLPLSGAVPALAALGLLLGAPFFAAGSRRLADATLAAGGTACPAGLDAPVPLEDRP